MSAYLQGIRSAETAGAAEEATGGLLKHLQEAGVNALETEGITEELKHGLRPKADSKEARNTVVAIDTLVRGLGKGSEPFFFPLIESMLEKHADTGMKGSVTDLKVSIDRPLKYIAKSVPADMTPLVIRRVFNVIDSNAKWKSKVAALNILNVCATSAKEQISERLGQYVPHLSEALKDTKAEVSAAAHKTAVTLCGVISNPDIQPFVEDLVDGNADPTAAPAVIKKLSSAVWVREVDGPTLAVIVPILERGLSDRSTTCQRQTVVIVANLFKLVRSPDVAAPHAAKLLPGTVRMEETASFPEIREFAKEAHASLVKATEGAAQPPVDRMAAARVDEEALVKDLEAALPAASGLAKASIAAVSYALSHLVRKSQFNEGVWREDIIVPYLHFFSDKAASVAKELRDKWYQIDLQRVSETATGIDEDEDGSEVIADLPFSLAYGGLLLLNHTILKLRRGHRYGVAGANGSGKSTLLKAINRKQIENFPEHISAAYVEHDIDGDESGITVFQLMKEEERISADDTEIRAALTEIGFTPERQDAPIMALSGGWKMRVALARAMLMKVDLLLLDEPTNHLDVQSVAWLQDYLNGQKNTTSLIVSHDSGFLDAVCTNIIQYNNKKLVYYKGNLAAFVEKNPDAKSFYTLDASVVKFTFPPPGTLVGVRSRTRAILKMTDCTFTYPGAPKPQLSHVSCAVSMSSRVGVVGPNGAGKSTLIKLLTGETLPDSGKVEKHPNLRIAYVAQHAFHHIEEHLEKTAMQYIQWRYSDGVDKEQALKATHKVSPEEQALLDKPFTGRNGESRWLEKIVGRQKQKKSYQYEIKWRGMAHKFNTQLSREALLEHGLSKLVQEYDDFEASREGSGSREMNSKAVRELLEGVGLNGDIAEYNEMRGLSGGQKVKVVIAAAMWSKPQMLILDEPTNFLDRDALGGLAVGIKEWTGAFLCISHNQEFIGALCSEIWNVDNGVLTFGGKRAATDDGDEPTPAASTAPSAPDSTVATPAGTTPAGTAPGTPADGTPAGSGTEATDMNFKAAKGKKKMSRKQMKEREERRRLRTIAFLSSTVPGAVREPDTESDEEVDGKAPRKKEKKPVTMSRGTVG